MPLCPQRDATGIRPQHIIFGALKPATRVKYAINVVQKLGDVLQFPVNINNCDDPPALSLFFYLIHESLRLVLSFPITDEVYINQTACPSIEIAERR